MASFMSPTRAVVAVLACVAACTACVPATWKEHHEDQHAALEQQHEHLRLSYREGLFMSIDEVEEQYYAAQAYAILDRTKYDIRSSLKMRESVLHGEAIVQILACMTEREVDDNLRKEIEDQERKLDQIHPDEMEGVGSVTNEHVIIGELRYSLQRYISVLTSEQRKCWKDKREKLHDSVDRLKNTATKHERRLVKRANALVTHREHRSETERWPQEIVDACATAFFESQPPSKKSMEHCRAELGDRFRAHMQEMDREFMSIFKEAESALEQEQTQALTNLRGGKVSHGQ